MKKILYANLSDWIFVYIFFLIGALFFGYGFYYDLFIKHQSLLNSLADLKDFPAIYFLFYFWLKSIVIDSVRIIRKTPVEMPLLVYIFYGVQFFIVWAGNNLLYQNTPNWISPSQTRQYFLYSHPLLLWIFVDAVTSVLLYFFRIYSKFGDIQPNRNSIFPFMATDFIRALFSYIVVIGISIIFLLLEVT